MSREDNVGIFNGRLFYHLIDEKRMKFLCLLRSIKICQKRNLDIDHTNKAELA